MRCEDALLLGLVWPAGRVLGGLCGRELVAILGLYGRNLPHSTGPKILCGKFHPSRTIFKVFSSVWSQVKDIHVGEKMEPDLVSA